MVGWRAVIAALFAVLANLPAPPAAAEDEVEGRKRYRGGGFRLGGFFVGRIDTEILAARAGGVLGGRIDVTRDLGLGDSQTVPRAIFNYRFNKRHQINAGWYGFRRDGTRTLERAITLGDRVFEVGTSVESLTDIDVFKAAYTWVFHDEGKVMLGLSAGFHISDIDLGIATTDELTQVDQFENLTAPLPVFGGRLRYRISPKVDLAVAADWLFIDYQQYKGSLQDAHVFAELRLSRRFGFGGGLNVFSLNVEVDDEVFWDLRHVFTGWMLYGTVYF